VNDKAPRLTGTDPGAGTPPAGRSRRRRLLVAAAVAVAVVAASAAVGWRASSGAALDRVLVRVSTPDCVGAAPVFHRSEGFGRVPAVRMREGMDCTVAVRVANRGERPVHLDRVVLPFMGPGGGTGARVEHLNGRAPLGPDSRRTGRIDAVFPVDGTLRPGASVDFDVPFTFRPAGCSSPGSVMTVSDMPRVVVSALGQTRRIAGGPLALIGTPDSSCDE
jgi:hypothetical protein